MRAYAVQHHPEIVRAQVAAWEQDDAELVARVGLDAAAMHSDTERHYQEFERLTDRFFETIAMLLIAANYELTKHVTPGRETWLCPLLTLAIGLWLVGLIWIRTCPWIPEGAGAESSGSTTTTQPDGEPG